jgi:hypothetical protein
MKTEWFADTWINPGFYTENVCAKWNSLSGTLIRDNTEQLNSCPRITLTMFMRGKTGRILAAGETETFRRQALLARDTAPWASLLGLVGVSAR